MPRHTPPGHEPYQLQRLWYAWRAPQLLEEYDAQVVSCSRKLVSRLLVHRLHRPAARSGSGRSTGPKEIERLLRPGVDGICSDDPASHGWA